MAAYARVYRAVKIYFDMGNCLSSAEDPIEQARICAPLTAQIHIKGGPTTPLGAMPLIPLREILEAAGFCVLKMTGYRS